MSIGNSWMVASFGSVKIGSDGEPSENGDGGKTIDPPCRNRIDTVNKVGNGQQ